MANRKTRNLKVYGMSGYKFQQTATIMLKGNWLMEAGFNIGDFISVRCENGKLIIEPDVERARMEEAEKAFMDRELKSLQKKFETEKEKLHAQFVAENAAGMALISFRHQWSCQQWMQS